MQKQDAVSNINQSSDQLADNNAVTARREEGGTFYCHQCGLQETYSYKGQKPPFCKGVKLFEDGYVAKDPFSPPNEHSFLLLGSDCSLCGQQTCQDSSCSIFYEHRFCNTCAIKEINKFPVQIHSKINQRNGKTK
jgi:hypothetical protein